MASQRLKEKPADKKYKTSLIIIYELQNVGAFTLHCVTQMSTG